MSAPYYEDEFVTLYHGDCLTIDAWLAADVLVTDPPYGTETTAGNPAGGYGRRQNHGNGRTGATIANDVGTATRDAALSLWSGPALVFGSPRMADPPMAVVDRLVWDKKRPGMNGGPWRYRHETIYVTDGFERVSDAAVSVLTFFPDQKQHIHGKPLDLMAHLVGACPPGTVADPFAGSGSTLVAAKRLGRKAIGVELDERYCEIAAKRLAQGVLDFGAAS